MGCKNRSRRACCNARVRSQDIYAASAGGYGGVRRPDARIGRQLAMAVGGGTVLNVGAGTGSCETHTGVRAAVEPSRAMVARRPPGAAPVVRGRAEALPLGSGSVDVALAVLTVHHWADLAAGMAEMKRVARRRVVVMTWDPSLASRLWLMRYLPPALVEWDVARFAPLERLMALLPGARCEMVPIPHDCSDGFMGAYWRRPQAYLAPEVRQGISSLAAWEGRLDAVWAALAADLRSGAWHERHGHLLAEEALDLGYRLILAPAPRRV
jgi:SAM-dependent methyltransferase